MSKSNLGNFLSGKGFYIALALCVAGAGGAALVAVNRTLNAIDMAQPAPENDTAFFEEAPVADGLGEDVTLSLPEAQAAEQEVTDLPKPSEEPAEEETSSGEEAASSVQEQQPSESGEPAVQSSASTAQEPLPGQQASQSSLPVDSAVVKTFSGTQLVRNETLNDWRVHNGIDIRADAGTTVVSCFAGQVTKIYEDPMWGNVVEIMGRNDQVAVYSGLGEEIPLTVGEVVQTGTPVGTVGEIPCESADGPHLHLSVLQNGAYVDPLEVLG